MRSNILITGADGFIGHRLTNALSNKFNVKAIVRQCKLTMPHVNQYEIGDLSKVIEWKHHLKGTSTIIHLASVAHNRSNDREYIKEVNINAAIRLAKEAVEANVKRFIFVSSISVLGDKTQVPFNESFNRAPQSYMAECKCLVEKVLLEISEKTNMDVVIIRPALVYGDNAPGNIKKLTHLIGRFPILPFALCKNKRSFISLDNLVDFISVCIHHPKAANEIFCISDTVDVSIRDFTNEIAVGLNKKLIQLPVPIFIFKLVGKLTGKIELIEQLIGDLQVDSSKAISLLDWKPPVTMNETFKYYK